MELKFKRLHKYAVVPKYANPGDNGLDLVATGLEHFGKYVEYSTHVCVEIPEGYVGLLFSRSSVTKKDLLLKNAVGVLDSSFRGPITFRFYRTSGPQSDIYQVGEKIGQLVVVPAPRMELIEVDDLSSTVRGHGAYGSTDK